MQITFELDGKPQGKARPRYSRKSGTMYTPSKTKDYEEYVAWAYKQAGGEMLEGAVRLFVAVSVAPPKSATKAQRAAMLNGEVHPCVKPDGDNILKIIADGLNGVAYKDDKQIVEWRLYKEYGEEDKVYVTVEAV